MLSLTLMALTLSSPLYYLPLQLKEERVLYLLYLLSLLKLVKPPLCPLVLVFLVIKLLLLLLPLVAVPPGLLQGGQVAVLHPLVDVGHHELSRRGYASPGYTLYPGPTARCSACCRGGPSITRVSAVVSPSPRV